MVRVIVDTNIVGGVKNQPMTNRELLRLLDETERGNLQLVIPEVVLREAANLWAERVISQAGEYTRARAVLRQAGLVDEEHAVRPELGDIRAEEEERLRQLMTEAGAAIAPLPQIGHDEVVERALGRRQPFDKKGRNGYRDVILWETVLAIAGEGGSLVFIAKDQAAFFEESKSANGLATNLHSEFEQAAGQAASIVLFDGIEQGLSASLELAEGEQRERIAAQEVVNQATLRDLNEMLRADTSFANLVSDAVDEALRNWDLGQDLREFGIPDSDVHDAYIDTIESLHKIKFISTHRATGGEVLAELSAEVVAFGEAKMAPGTAIALDEHPQVGIREINYDASIAEGQVEVVARVAIDLVVDPGAGRVTSLAIVSGFEPLTPKQFFLGAEGPPGIRRDIQSENSSS